jgi:hypothetical protein
MDHDAEDEDEARTIPPAAGTPRYTNGSIHAPGRTTASVHLAVLPRNSTPNNRDVSWLQRPIKITSYDWSGHVGGYIAANTGRLPSLQPDGRTFKLSAFQSSNILQWEKDELIPFYFNDAGNHPAEGISQRHAGGFNTRAQIDVKGGAAVGCIGGQAVNIKYRRWYGPIPSPAPTRQSNASFPRRTTCITIRETSGAARSTSLM